MRAHKNGVINRQYSTKASATVGASNLTTQKDTFFLVADCGDRIDNLSTEYSEYQPT